MERKDVCDMAVSLVNSLIRGGLSLAMEEIVVQEQTTDDSILWEVVVATKAPTEVKSLRRYAKAYLRERGVTLTKVSDKGGRLRLLLSERKEPLPSPERAEPHPPSCPATQRSGDSSSTSSLEAPPPEPVATMSSPPESTPPPTSGTPA
jgi:hypothetical protein